MANEMNLKERDSIMAQKIKVWYDPEGDFLEVLFSDKPGYMRQLTMMP
jgi:hypothetical protein